ncbi:MAG: hypothetical protein JWM34_2953 [Ilumatobacteraceae bacterium]|nr:hypothetical protein [Ilumatobacteraceae bacterium]
MRQRLIVLALVMTTLAVTVAACGAPKSSGFSPIALGNIPDALTATTAAPTTTTTEPTTTSTIEPIETTTTLEPATTTLPTTAVMLYFISGQQLASQVQYTTNSPEILTVLGLLGQGPVNPVSGQRTAIPKGTLFVTSKFRGVVTVDLPKNFFDVVGASDPYDERLAVGQIVLTLTQLVGGLVRFTINGEPISVPLGNGDQSDPGGALAMEDYEVLLGSSPPPSTTTTTTTVVDTVPAPPVTDPATTVAPG